MRSKRRSDSTLQGSTGRTSTRQGGRVSAVLDYAINVERVGDIVERSLSRLTMKKIDNQLQYSPDGMAEIEDLVHDTIENLRLAQRVFINRDAQIARRLMEGKVAVRLKERVSVERHRAWLQDRRPGHTADDFPAHGRDARSQAYQGPLDDGRSPIVEDVGMLRESHVRSGAKSSNS